MILSFTDISFWLFFAAVLLGLALCYNRLPVRNGFLFLCSLVFYFFVSGYFVFLLLFSVVLNYWLGRAVGARSREIPRQARNDDGVARNDGDRVARNDGGRGMRMFWAVFAITINLVVLFYFKYIDFINHSFNSLFGTMIFAEEISPTLLGLALPAGISFYTFNAISYIADVYKRRISPVRNFINFGFYLSFFPTIIAGPVLRAGNIIPQLRKYYQLTSREFSIALFFILGGLLKKIVVADFISLQFLNRVFDSPSLYTSLETWMAMYGYSVQIYCDFSGYTDIAIGVAMLLGFKMPLNFNSPYKATSLTDFWHRWHISLSTWLRDYLYIPLGGNRNGHARTLLNVLITMLLGGLWYGAGLKFLVWAAIHGVVLSLEKIFRWILGLDAKRAGMSGTAAAATFEAFATFDAIGATAEMPVKSVSNGKRGNSGKRGNVAVRILGFLLTFNIVSFAWIFFRADSLDSAVLFIKHLFSPTAISWKIVQNYAFVFSLIVLALVLHLLPVGFKNKCKEIFYDLPLVIKFLAVLAVLAIIFFFKTAEL